MTGRKMLMKPCRFSALLLLVLGLVLCGPVIASDTSDNGRYQAITIPATRGSAQVFILDTKDGHLWRYWQQPGSEGVLYLGEIRPGAKPGEVIFRQLRNDRRAF
jgi:hypothetical protein